MLCTLYPCITLLPYNHLLPTPSDYTSFPFRFAANPFAVSETRFKMLLEVNWNSIAMLSN